MDKDQFREALWSGLGRAVVYARENDVREWRDVILDACLNCYAVDVQCEGTPAPFMLDVIDATNDREYYAREIVKSLSGGGDDVHTLQRFRLASYLAVDGDERAKRAIYANFNPGPRMVEQMADDFIAMDGLEGFLFVVKKEGALLLADAKSVNFGCLLWTSTEKFGEDTTFAALRQASEGDPEVDAFLQAALAYREREKRRDIERAEVKAMSFGELKSRLWTIKPYRLSFWGDKTSPENLSLAAEELQRSETPEEQLLLLRIFYRRQFPLDPSILLRLADSNNEEISLAATLAVSHVTHPAVRELAFRLISQKRPERAHAIDMLAENFHLGDHEIALEWFLNERDRDIRHHLGLDLCRFWDRHPQPERQVQMLLDVYERGTCSYCREHVVSDLIELNALPPGLRAECKYDSNEEIRSVVTITAFGASVELVAFFCGGLLYLRLCEFL